MKKKGKFLGILALGMLYSTMFLLPYIKYIFYDALIEATGLNNTQLGFSLSVYIAVCMISTPISGYLADKFSIKRQLLLTGIAHSILTVVYPSVMHSYPLTLLIYGGMGFTSMMLFWSQTFKGISLLGPVEEQGTLYGLFESANGLGSMIFNFAALALFARFSNSVSSLKAVIYFYGAATLISTLLVLVMYRPQLDEIEEEKVEVVDGEVVVKKASTSEILSVLKLPEVWMFSFVVFGFYAFYAGSSYLTPYFSTVLGVSVVFSGSLAVLRSYGTRLVGGSIAGIIADKISTTKFIIISYAILFAMMIVFVMLPSDPRILVFITILMFALALVTVMIKGVAFSMLDEINIDPKVIGTAIAIATMIGYNIPDLILHPVFGMILDNFEAVAAYRYIFWILTAFIFIGLVATLILWSKVKKNNKAIEDNL